MSQEFKSLTFLLSLLRFNLTIPLFEQHFGNTAIPMSRDEFYHDIEEHPYRINMSDKICIILLYDEDTQEVTDASIWRILPDTLMGFDLRHAANKADIMIPEVYITESDVLLFKKLYEYILENYSAPTILRANTDSFLGPS